MKREYHKWWTDRLGRDMELLVFGHAGAKVLVFPTRMGRFYEYENLRMPQRLSEKINEGQLQLFCIDGIDNEWTVVTQIDGSANYYQKLLTNQA